MKVKQEIDEILTYLENEKGVFVSPSDIDRFTERQEDDTHQPIVLKVLSLLGGVFAMIAFAMFLFLTRLYESTAGLISVGLVCIIVGIIVGREVKRLLLDTFAISIFVLGFVILAFAFDKLDLSISVNSLICAGISVLCVFLIRRQILILVSMFIAGFSLMWSIFSLPAYSFEFGMVYCAVLAIGLVLLCVFEHSLITVNAMTQRVYQPAVNALMVVFLLAIAYLDAATIDRQISAVRWVSVVVLLFSYLILLYRLVDILDLTVPFHKIVIYLLGVILVLPGLITYGVSGSLLVVLAGFVFSRRVFIVLGLVAYLYFMSRFYYTINMDLLGKSVVLMVSGLLLLAIYCKVYFKALPDGKN
jgi:hypothetical protein